MNTRRASLKYKLVCVVTSLSQQLPHDFIAILEIKDLLLNDNDITFHQLTCIFCIYITDKSYST